MRYSIKKGECIGQHLTCAGHTRIELPSSENLLPALEKVCFLQHSARHYLASDPQVRRKENAPVVGVVILAYSYLNVRSVDHLDDQALLALSRDLLWSSLRFRPLARELPIRFVLDRMHFDHSGGALHFATRPILIEAKPRYFRLAPQDAKTWHLDLEAPTRLFSGDAVVLGIQRL